MYRREGVWRVPRPVYAWANYFFAVKKVINTKRKWQKNVFFSDQATKTSLTPSPFPSGSCPFFSDFLKA